VFERFYVVLHGYRRWYVLRLSVVVLLYAWLVGWYFRNLSFPPIFHFVVLSSILIPNSILLGIRLKPQFDPFRSRLIPGWSSTHILVAAGQSLLMAVSLAVISLGAGLGGGLWNGWSVVGMGGILWFEVLACFSIGYLFHPAIFMGLAIVLPLLGYGRDRIEQLLSILTDGSQPVAPLMLIVLNAAGTMALLRRMLLAHEEMPEFRMNVFNLAEAQRQQWASDLPVRGFRYRLWAWRNRSLDAIPRRLGGDLRSQIRHFQLGLTAAPGFLPISVILILTFWTVSGFTSIPFGDSNVFFLTWFSVSSTFHHLLTSQKHSFQWVFMLPLRRKEIVVRYLGAMFSSYLRGWLAVSMAVFVVRWMPSPGVVHEMPSLLYIIESFSALLPVFGIGSLIVLWPKGVRAKRAAATVLISAVLLVLIAGTIARTTGIHDEAPVFAIAAFITGIGLNWYSYRSWLQADLS